MAEIGFSNDELEAIEREHREGLSSESIVGLLRGKGIKLTEATLRKYVQLGILPRSRRVGLPGGIRGSQGLYPATIVRRIQILRTMMRQFTIEEIKQQTPFVRGDVEELEACLDRIFQALRVRAGDEVSEAERLATALVATIAGIEARAAGAA